MTVVISLDDTLQQINHWIASFGSPRLANIMPARYTVCIELANWLWPKGITSLRLQATATPGGSTILSHLTQTWCHNLGCGIQWNLSNMDPVCTKTIVLISEVSLFQGRILCIYIKLGLSQVS